MLRGIAAIVLILILASACASRGRQDIGQLPGHKYQTRLGCVRTKSADRFDPLCDIPLLGFRGFSPP